MRVGREPGHVDPDLGDDSLCAQVLNAWDRHYLLDCDAKGPKVLLHFRVDRSDRCSERIDLIEMKAQQEPMLLPRKVCNFSGSWSSFSIFALSHFRTKTGLHPRSSEGRAFPEKCSNRTPFPDSARNPPPPRSRSVHRRQAPCGPPLPAHRHS